MEGVLQGTHGDGVMIGSKLADCSTVDLHELAGEEKEKEKAEKAEKKKSKICLPDKSTYTLLIEVILSLDFSRKYGKVLGDPRTEFTYISSFFYVCTLCICSICAQICFVLGYQFHQFYLRFENRELRNSHTCFVSYDTGYEFSGNFSQNNSTGIDGDVNAVLIKNNYWSARFVFWTLYASVFVFTTVLATDLYESINMYRYIRHININMPAIPNVKPKGRIAICFAGPTGDTGATNMPAIPNVKPKGRIAISFTGLFLIYFLITVKSLISIFVWFLGTFWLITDQTGVKDILVSTVALLFIIEVDEYVWSMINNINLCCPCLRWLENYFYDDTKAGSIVVLEKELKCHDRWLTKTFEYVLIYGAVWVPFILFRVNCLDFQPGCYMCNELPADLPHS